MAKVGPYPLVKIAALAGCSQSPHTHCFLLLLDSVVDPHNLGALIRTASGVGTDGVVITRHRSASPTPAVSNTSAGALEHVRLAVVTNMAETIKALKSNGIWVIGMDRRADRSVFDSDLSGSIAIVIGGEEKGIRPLVRKRCDMLLSIPQSGTIDSLNASVAGAVVMYEVYRQRSVGTYQDEH
jgi:23S rRNA (guanosine2251-2'-O)-methyltransferase